MNLNQFVNQDPVDFKQNFTPPVEITNSDVVKYQLDRYFGFSNYFTDMVNMSSYNYNKQSHTNIILDKFNIFPSMLNLFNMYLYYFFIEVEQYITAEEIELLHDMFDYILCVNGNNNVFLLEGDVLYKILFNRFHQINQYIDMDKYLYSEEECPTKQKMIIRKLMNI
jgi:hypothetical protein